jgi:exonuclease VII large subunit
MASFQIVTGSPTPTECGPEHQKALEYLNRLRASGLFDETSSVISEAKRVIEAQQDWINSTRSRLDKVLDLLTGLQASRARTQERLHNLRALISEAIQERDAKIAELERQVRGMQFDQALDSEQYPPMQSDYFSKN